MTPVQAPSASSHGVSSDPERRHWRLVIAGCVVVVVLAFARPLLFGDAVVGSEHLTEVTAAHHEIARATSDLRIPEWTDRLGIGAPISTAVRAGSLYPPMWLMGALPMPWASDLFLILHLMLAAVGASKLVRALGATPLASLVAGAVVAVSGVSMASVVDGTTIALAWSPWMAWAALRIVRAHNRMDRLACIGMWSAFLGAQLLAGVFALSVVAVVFAVTIAIIDADDVRVAGLWLGIAIVWGVVLGAVTLVVGSLAVEPDPVEVARHPLRLLAWVWPDITGNVDERSLDTLRAVLDRSSATQPTSNVYLSMPVVMLAALGTTTNRRLGWGLVALTVLAALPMITSIGVGQGAPSLERTAHLGQLALAVLAGLGLTRVAAGKVSRRAAIVTLGLAGLMIALLLAMLVFRDHLALWLSGRTTGRAAYDGAGIVSGWLAAGSAAVVISILCAVLVWIAHRSEHASKIAAAIAALCVAHLVANTARSLPTVDRQQVGVVPSLLAKAQRGEQKPRRLYRPRRLLGANEIASVARRHQTAGIAIDRFHFATLPAVHRIVDKNYRQMWRAASGAGERMLDLFGVELVVLPQSLAVPSGMPVLTRTDDNMYVLAENEHRRARAFVAPRWLYYAETGDIIDELFPAAPGDRKPIGLSTVRLVGSGDGGGVAAPTRAHSCSLESSRPERVELVCRSDNGGYVVLLDAWALGWTATVDGKSVAIERADVIARAVRVSAGQHRVHFEYRTPGLRLAGAVSALGWLNILALLVVVRRMR